MEYVIKDYILPEELAYMRKELKWKEISIEQLKKGIDHTMISVSVYHDNHIVGLGRLVGDYSCKGVLSDIMVLPLYQGKGVGKLIVTNILNKTKETLNDGELFQIEATPTNGNRDFYVKCGMKYKPENQDGVYAWLSK